MDKGKIYIALVNYNGHEDTLDCLVSLTKLEHPNFQVVLIDNGSKKESLQFIMDVLKGNGQAKYDPKGSEILLNSDYQVLNNKFEVEESYTDEGIEAEKPFHHPITIIKQDPNVGFAKGNNICFEYMLQQDDFAHAWVLNNDTIVEPDSLSAMVREMDSDKKIGMVGSVLIYNDERDKVQTVGGGKFYPMLSITKLMYKNTPVEDLKNVDKDAAVKKIDFLMGASVLVRQEVLKEVGVFDEDYFVYVEEMDWMHRMQKAGWTLSIAIDSIVYHKDSSSSKDFKEFYYYQLTKNNMVFLKKHYNYFYILMAIVPVLLNTVRITRKKKNILKAIEGLYDGITFKSKNKMAIS